MEELGDMSGRSELPAPALAVKKAHHALYDRDTSTFSAVGEERAYELRSGEEGVEVATRSTSSKRVIRGIYKVRANLEGGHPVALRVERGHEAGGDGGLSDAGVGACHDYAGSTYHSI